MAKYIYDDRISIDVVLQYCRDNDLVLEKASKEHPGETHYSFSIDPDEIIEQMINKGLLKLHTELGEMFYHPTAAGMESIKCQCGNHAFDEEELMAGKYHHE